MRLGLVTDIHNHAAELARALALFREREVDQVLTIGDTCDAFSNSGAAAEVAALLHNCGAVGVWGNHDFGLCWEVSEETRQRYPAATLDYLAQMKPRLTIGGCHFSHKESSVDAYDVLQLWNVSERRLAMEERAVLAFAAVDHPWQFVGHFHRWWATTPEQPVDWTGASPLNFEPHKRYFVIVAAVCDGWCAILDSEQARLEPLWCGLTEFPDDIQGGGFELR